MMGFFVKLFQYSLPRRVVFTSNICLTIFYAIYRLSSFLIIILWVWLNKGHIRVSSIHQSTVAFSIKEAFTTNFSQYEFNDAYVKPYEHEYYNRNWEPSDYAFKFTNEIQVITNLAITANQTLNTCPENPLYIGVVCYMPSDCKKGFSRPHGEQTGKCIAADFPYEDQYGNWSWRDACEIKGWCPVDRILPPLLNYSAVLIKTKNSTLWIENTVFFPEFNVMANNSLGRDAHYFVNCRFDPQTNPNCPVFFLGDIVKHAKNNNQSYEEMAKFGGAIIVININYECFESDISNCIPSYSFVRVDAESIFPKAGYTSFGYAVFYDFGKTRTFIHSLRIRFVIAVTAIVKRYDWFSFITQVFAYSGLFQIFLKIFEIGVRKFYHNYRVRFNDNLDIYVYNENEFENANENTKSGFKYQRLQRTNSI